MSRLEARSRLPRAIVAWALARPATALATWFLLALLASLGVARLEIETSTESVLDRRDPAWAYYQSSQDEFGGENFEVLTLATGRNNPAGIKKFFDEIGVTNLPRHQDPKSAVAREMGVFGLPITVIIDPEGNEIARLRGEADWASESARAVIGALVAGS